MSDKRDDLNRVSRMEINNQKQGRSGSATPYKTGPAYGGGAKNPTKGGGINRRPKDN